MKKVSILIALSILLSVGTLVADELPLPTISSEDGYVTFEPVYQAWAPSIQELWNLDPQTADYFAMSEPLHIIQIDLAGLWDEELTDSSEHIVFHSIASLAQTDTEIQSDAIDKAVPVSLRNNEHYRESERLKQLSEEAFEYGDYDAAANYAAEAAKAARRSDEYVAFHLLMREVNTAIFAANTRLNWASSVGADKTYADRYSAAQGAYAQAINHRADGKWNESLAEAKKVLSLLSDVRETVPLPATYVVRPWATTRDCFWNISKYSFVYNNPTLWRNLYNANRTKLRRPDNPDLLHPGIVLTIPSINGEYREGRYVPGRSYPVFGKQ